VFLNDKHIQEQVLDFLGVSNYIAFNGALEQSNDIIKEISRGVAGLVPAYKVSCMLRNSP